MQIRPLVDRDLAVVFHDLTTVRIHGEGTVEDDLRGFGMNKEIGGIALPITPPLPLRSSPTAPFASCPWGAGRR